MGQGHRHGHGHAAGRAVDRSRLRIVLAVTLTVLVAELVGAWWSGSLALLADAGHMATDAGAVTLALAASYVASRPVSARRSFGWHRAEILAALVNAVVLLAVCAFLAGVLTTVLWRTTWVTLRQLRDLRERQRIERLERVDREMKAKAAMVRTKPAGETEPSVPQSDTTVE